MPKQVNFFILDNSAAALAASITRPTGTILYKISTPLQPNQAEEGMGRFSMFSMVCTAIDAGFHSLGYTHRELKETTHAFLCLSWLEGS